MERPNYYVMCCGVDGEGVPDRWIGDWCFERIDASHLTGWWSPHRINLPRPGDIVIQASSVTGKLLGIFRVLGPREPHPLNPQRWPYGIELEPLVLWDGRYAPTAQGIGVAVPRTYARVDEDHEYAGAATPVMNLIRYHLPALSDELLAPEGAR